MSYHRIYIAKAVEDKFLEEPNKSGLLNDLLLKHYGESPSAEDTRHYPRRYDYQDPTPIEEDEDDTLLPLEIDPANPRRAYNPNTDEWEKV